MGFDAASDRSAMDRADLSTRSSLITGLQDCTPERWTQFALVYTRLLRFWICRKHVPAAHVDDVLQESLRSIWQGIRTFERNPHQGTFRGWLRAIVDRRVADFFRRQSPVSFLPDQRLTEVATPPQKPPEVIDNEQALLDDLRVRALELVRQSTTEKTWQMFWMSVVEEVPTAEIASRFAVSNAAVRVAKQRVLQRLRDLLVDDFSQTNTDSPPPSA